MVPIKILVNATSGLLQFVVCMTGCYVRQYTIIAVSTAGRVATAKLAIIFMVIVVTIHLEFLCFHGSIVAVSSLAI
jgi:hypothetical protein